MFTSPKPWSLSRASHEPMGTIKDTIGCVVGVFPDARNAEYVLEMEDKIKLLEKQVEDLECKFNVRPDIKSLSEI